MQTLRSPARCTVKEDADGQPFLWFEGERLGEVQVGMDLQRGTTYAEATALAAQINAKVVGIMLLVG